MNSKQRSRSQVTIDRSRPVALYHQLKDALLDRMARMETGQKLPSVRSLIAAYGVSLPVVRQALAELERDGTIEIRKGSGSYVRHVPDGMAAPPRRLQYVFCGERTGDPFFSRVLFGFEREAREHGYEVGYGVLTGTEALPDAAGVVLAGTGATRELYSRIRARGTAAVVAGELAGEDATPADIARVEHDNRDGARAATGHLVALGHTRIAIVCGRGHHFWNERRAGYEDALRSSGIDPDHRLAVSCDENTAEAAYRALKGTWRQVRSATAIFCANDRLASGAYRLLGEKRISIPADVSVVGFDDLEYARDANPPLTTIHVDMDLMGRWAARLLLQQLDTPGDLTGRMVLPLELVTRSSSAPPRAR